MSDVRVPSEPNPPLYEGRSVPFDKLSPADFEKCVFGCFIAIQSHQRLRVDGQPSGSGDGGFDVYGVDVDTNRTACIQCKRQNASLGLPLLAKEVAKVAMTARLEKSDVGVHIFICTGGVTQELRGLLREKDRARVADAVQSALGDAAKGELSVLRKRLIEADDDPEQIVGSYVRALHRLVAWDIEEFDAALAPAWESAFPVLERYFKVAIAVREHPRALFPRDTYQERCRKFVAVVEPQLEEGVLPAGLVESSNADPGPREPGPRKDLRTVKSLASIAPGETALVVAEGGAGKTTLLKLIRAEVATRSSDSTIAIVVSCAEYTPGALDVAVHAQLGVRSGSWRMLPDKVLLLCDGINEAFPQDVRALFAELRPLLMSNHIACIFTSREDSRAVRTVLPTIPCATLRLVPLSPGRVQALARHELTEGSEVQAFVDAHRAMATRAGGPFMWTPFAVRVGLKRWKEARQLGNTLGDLLEAIVSERAERDLEIVSLDKSVEFPKASVLAIASAMAFQMIVVDGQVGCPANSIVGTLKRAARRCSDALGADGLNSSQIIGLLQKHDLVQRTSDDSFQWNHQLVAGALAGRHLASRWKQHLGMLQQPLADDAWVFATRHAPQSELDEYLGELFHADLMLGARATTELPFEERDRSLKYLGKALQPGQPEGLRVRALFALSRVGTDRALSLLRKLKEEPRDELGFQAARALAYAGDREFLRELGAEMDHRREVGWMESGGEIAIWETASLADRIAIARERLTSVPPGEPVNESLSLVGADASLADVPLIELHFRASKDLTAWRTALKAMKRGDADRAQALLDESLASVTESLTKAEMTTMGVELGLSVDVDTAFLLLMDLCAGESQTTETAILSGELVEKVLGNVPLTTAIRNAVVDQLSTGTRQKKSRLWQLATRIESPVIARVALDSFARGFDSVGMAANFFLAHQSLREAHRGAIEEALERYLQDRRVWFTFDSWRALVLVAEMGLTERTAAVLQQMLVRLVSLLETAENGAMPKFDESEAHIANGFEVASARIRLKRYVGPLAPAAVAAQEFLPTSLLLKFLHFDLTHATPGKAIVEVYRGMDQTLIDDELESVRDPWAQRAGLEMVCEFGLTDRRLRLLRIHLEKTYCHLAALGVVQRALEKCWSSQACAMVVETVAGFDAWPQEWEQCFWDFVAMVETRITPADRDLVDHYIPLAKTPFAGRILQIWGQATLGSRVGLSRATAHQLKGKNL